MLMLKYKNIEINFNNFQASSSRRLVNGGSKINRNSSEIRSEIQQVARAHCNVPPSGNAPRHLSAQVKLPLAPHQAIAQNKHLNTLGAHLNSQMVNKLGENHLEFRLI